MAVDKYDTKRRRASNIVWTAAGSYRYNPDFLAFKENGKPDLYLNAVIGLTAKYYDMTLTTMRWVFVNIWRILQLLVWMAR